MSMSRRPNVHSGGTAPGGQPATGSQTGTGAQPTAGGQPTPGGQAPSGGVLPGGGPPGGRPQGRPPQGGPDFRQTATDVIRRAIAALNARDWKTLQGLHADDFFDGTWFGNDPVKPQAVTRLIALFIDSAPDWQETLDEFLAIDPTTGWMTYLVTGRGTLRGKIVGRDPDGRQIAIQEVRSARIQDGKIVEFRQHKNGLFENPYDEVINAPADLQEARAEQGGSIQTREQIAERQRLLDAYASGAISAGALGTSLAATAQPPRCQAILRENFRRCQKAATNGIYCDVHSVNVDPVHTV